MMDLLAPQILSEACIRSVPCGIYIGASRSVGRRPKLLVAAALLALGAASLAAGADPRDRLLLPLLGLAYLAALALPLRLAAHAFAGRPPSRAVLLAMVVFACIGVPTLVLPRPASMYVALLGWEMSFAAYSFCMEAGRGERRPTVGQVLTFLIIDPTLVFAERGQQRSAPALRPAALLRMVGGLGALSLHHVLYEAAYQLPALAVAPLYAVTTARGYVHLVVHHVARLLSGYAGHSGLASLQIGWMRTLGYEVGERYRYPLLATSPLDFWRRWNIYVGSWAKRYVFIPLSHRLRRRARWAPSSLSMALAILVTFLAIGGAHDVMLFVRAGLGAPGGTVVFALHAVLLIAWLGAARLRLWSATLRAGRPLLLLISAGRWVLFMHLLLFTLWIAIPAMSGEGLDPVRHELTLLLRGGRG